MRPGVLLVRASFLLFVKALITLDFPELDRPAKATSLPVSAGDFVIEGALIKNSVLLNEIVFDMFYPQGILISLFGS